MSGGHFRARGSAIALDVFLFSHAASLADVMLAHWVPCGPSHSAGLGWDAIRTNSKLRSPPPLGPPRQMQVRDAHNSPEDFSPTF